MEEKSTLEQLKEQMTNLSKSIQDKEEYIAALEMIPLIAKYNASLYDREKLQEEYELKKAEYEEKFQQECPHPLYYFKEDHTFVDDIYKGLVIIHRKCLRCMFEKKSEEIMKLSIWESEKENLIYESTHGLFPYYCGCKPIEIPYNVINQEFLDLESEGYSFEEIRDILYSKYTEKNEDLAKNLKMKYIPKKSSQSR